MVPARPRSGTKRSFVIETPAKPPPPRRSHIGLMLQLAAVTLVAALLALLVWRVVNVGQGGRLVSAVRAHKKPLAPDFRLKVLWAHDETWGASARTALRDGVVSLSELRGQPVVLNFWASWCSPCRHEAPRLIASANAHRGAVVFLGLDVQDFPSDARSFLRHFHVNYVSVRDGGGGSYDDYGLTGLPETYFLDRRGRIVAHVVGEISRTALEAGIDSASGNGGKG
jgi:cytochrome c biogenesis protein CcmG, thiol:disulfide interchange protein DsbE